MKKLLFIGLLSCLAFAFTACEEDDEATVKDVTLTYAVNMPLDNTYAAYVQKFDSVAVCKAFGGLSYDEFWEYLDEGEVIAYTAIAPDGTIDDTAPTANGNGHWFDATGAVCTWGTTAAVYSEMLDEQFHFNLGQYPDHTAVGNTFTIKQGFIYTKGSKSALATLVFNITITAATK